MEQIILVCGKWMFEKRWMFVVDNTKGSRILTGNINTSFDDFVGMVYEDYGLDKRVVDLQLSYMFPKKIMQRLPPDTPPAIIGNSRQFQAFIGQSKSDTLRLCVEVKKKVLVESKEVQTERLMKVKDDGVKSDDVGDECIDGFMSVDRGKNVAHEEDDGDSSDDDSLFDYCDDSDGTDSEDENYSCYGIPEEEKADETKLPIKKRQTEIFLPQTDDVQDFVKLEIESLDFVVGETFETKVDLETRLKMLTVVQKFDYDVDRSTPTLLIAKCWVKGCTWKIRATPVRDYPRFHVRVYVPEHTCSITKRSTRARQATPEILGRLYKDFVGGVGPTVLPVHVAEAMNKRFHIKMEYWKAYRTLKYARELVNGTPESGYEQLPKYLYMIKKANPGTMTHLEVDSEQRFKSLFIAFGASISGFTFMRKVVVVDGTHLKGKYKGTLLTATAQDGNFHIYPIAFAMVDTENDGSWEWFFRQLSNVIPDDRPLAIISDRHKSTIKSQV